MKRVIPLLLGAVGLANLLGADETAAIWAARAPWNDPNYFPIAVWLQNPSRAEIYRKAGFNTYVGLWRGPTQEQLAQLKRAGLHVICSQNAVGLEHRDDPTIIGWMHGDEPDNAQAKRDGPGYGPPILPEKIIGDYERLKATDATRPVLLNLGQGVAWDDYVGRGVRRRHPEDYAEYLKGCDIGSFDIYPANHDNAAVAGKLWFVADGVTRLLRWSDGKKTVWNCLECTRIHGKGRKPTPAEVRAEAWMALIHGSRGLIYFVHQFQPTSREAALLDDPEMLAAVSQLNHQIASLAPVLNSPTFAEGVRVETKNAEVPVAAIAKRQDGASYIFAVAMRDGATEASFSLADAQFNGSVEVIGEARTIAAAGGKFSDRFEPWAVHLYRAAHAK